MASDSYLQIDGIKGESTDTAHKDWIEILTFNQAITQPATAGGGISGGVKHEDFVVTKNVDLSSPKLYEMCSSGKHIKKVTLELMRASGNSQVKYMAIEMDEVVISGVTTSRADVSSVPTEKVSFNYGSIKWTYTQQNGPGGSAGGNVGGGWDLTQNKVAA